MDETSKFGIRNTENETTLEHIDNNAMQEFFEVKRELENEINELEDNDSKMQSSYKKNKYLFHFHFLIGICFSIFLKGRNKIRRKTLSKRKTSQLTWGR